MNQKPSARRRILDDLGSRIEALKAIEARADALQDERLLDALSPARARFHFLRQWTQEQGTAGSFERSAFLIERTTVHASSVKGSIDDSFASATMTFATLDASPWLEGPCDREEDFWRAVSRAKELMFGGRYRASGFLARGGTSMLFRGLDLKESRPVAIKVVSPGSSKAVRRSLEVTRPLDHPAILRVEASGEAAGGGLFLVMPLLEGMTLRDLRLAAPVREAWLLAFRRACEGVAYAHQAGVVHQDLKPANVQVEPDGRAIVLDWGLACRAGCRPEGITRVCGTPSYMAPEQVEGKAATPRSDVYTLGVVLYELLTGVNPSGRARDLKSLFHRIRKEDPPPPSLLAKHIPPGLDRLVLRCLAKDPAARYADAGQLLEALEGSV